VVSKEELLNAVWGDVVGGEGSLTRCIWMLRSALGDDNRSPRYIEIVATVGYRFVAKVEVAEGDSKQPDVPRKATKRDRGDFNGASTTLHSSGVAGDQPQADRATRDENLPPRAKIEQGRDLRKALLLRAGVLCLGLVIAMWFAYRPRPPLGVASYSQITFDGNTKCSAQLMEPGSTTTWVIRDALCRLDVSGGKPEQVSVPLPAPWLIDVSHAFSLTPCAFLGTDRI
jgi:hypothetical protein